MKNLYKTSFVLITLIALIAGCLFFIMINNPIEDNDPDSSDVSSQSDIDNSESSTQSVIVDEVQEPVNDNANDAVSNEARTADEEAELLSVSPKTQLFINAVKDVYEMVYNGDYVYGDSQSLPPCADGIISGDRLVARALWDIGYTDQPTGGIAVNRFETYLPEHGFEVITDKAQLRAGDIVLVTVYDRPDNKVIDYSFVLVSYDPVTEYCTKYDLSYNTIDGKSRLDCIQPFEAKLEENGNMRIFKEAFRIK